MATGLNSFDLADLQADRVAWTPPPALPTQRSPWPRRASPQDQPDDGYPPGEQLRNITSSLVNVRAEPGYLGKPAGDIVAQVPPGGVVEIIGERAVADNLVWWRIRYTARQWSCRSKAGWPKPPPAVCKSSDDERHPSRATSPRPAGNPRLHRRLYGRQRGPRQRQNLHAQPARRPTGRAAGERRQRSTTGKSSSSP